MLMPWNKSKLLTDSSSLEIARVTEILKKNGIEYECVTKKNESSMGTMVHGSMGASVGGGGSFYLFSICRPDFLCLSRLCS